MKKIIGLTFVLGVGLVMAFSLPKDVATKPLSVYVDVTPGIKFQNMTYAEALKLSEQTGKPIFIDCYTVWCGPCKLLDKNTFTNTELGQFFNENFINLKIEMEKDADGPELLRMFKVSGYPTLLFVNGKGEEMGKLMGYRSAEDLLMQAKILIKKKG